MAEPVTTRPTGFGAAVAETLPGVVRRIVAALHPEKVVLFGSYAYGTPTADSDVDLLIVVKTSARPVDRYLSVSRLLRPRPFPVDILVRTPDEIKSALDRRDSLICEILGRGKTLYEKQS